MRALSRPSFGRMRQLWQALCLIACVGLAGEGVGQNHDPYREDAVKAAFLYRFTNYVDWPREALEGSSFTIAVVGSDDVAEELERMLPRYTIKNLPARVIRVKRVQEAADAQLLYIGRNRVGDARAMIDALEDRPVLVVTDEAQGLDKGAAVNFIMVDRRVRFEISIPAAARVGLRIGADLLSVAARVRGTPMRSDALCMPTNFIQEDRSCLQRVAAR